MPSLVELSQWFRRRRFFFLNLSMYFRYFVIISPWKRMGHLFEQTWILFTQRCFVQSLVEIGSVVLEKRMKKWKVYVNNYDDNDDDDRQRTNFKQKIDPWLRWAKKADYLVWVIGNCDYECRHVNWKRALRQGGLLSQPV